MENKPNATAQILRGFVIMPYRDEFADIYGFIRNAAYDVRHPRIECTRLDHAGDVAPRITEALENRIEASDFCVADITPDPQRNQTLNPNVMWEIGYAMALKKKVFLISEGKVVLPFDLGGVYHLEYKRDSLAKTLSEPLKTEFERFAQNLLNVQIKAIGAGDGRGIGDEAEGLRREIARLSQVSDRQNAAVEQLRDLIATMMPSFSDRRTDDSHRFKPSLVAPSSKAIQALAGAWFNEESGSYAYMDVIDGRAVAAYCYQGDTALSGYYFDWQVLKEWHFARFTWVSSPGIHGFSFLRPIDHDRLIGAWWYDDDVEDDPRRNLPDLSTGYASTWVRQPKKAFPRWATSFLNDVRKGGLPV